MKHAERTIESLARNLTTIRLLVDALTVDVRSEARYLSSRIEDIRTGAKDLLISTKVESKGQDNMPYLQGILAHIYC